MATVGTGKHTYELVEDWGKLPKGWTLGQTGIVTDARDRVYLFNRSEHPLLVLDREGVFFTSWGEGMLSSAHGMFIDQQENIYLPVMNSHVVLKYRSRHELQRQGKTIELAELLPYPDGQPVSVEVEPLAEQPQAGSPLNRTPQDSYT